MIKNLLIFVTSVSSQWEKLPDGPNFQSYGPGCPTKKYLVGENSSFVFETEGYGGHGYPGGIKCRTSFKAEDSCSLLMECEGFNLQPPLRKTGICADFLRIKLKNGKKKLCGDDSFLKSSHNLGSKALLKLRTNNVRNDHDGVRCRVSCCPTQYLTTTSLEFDFKASDLAPIQRCDIPKPSGQELCGLKGSGKIVGGHDAKENDYTWLTLLTRESNRRSDQQGTLKIQGLPNNHDPFCGGSLVSRRWVVTASHCTLIDRNTGRPNPNEYRVVLGEYDRTVDSDNVRVYEVETMLRYPYYNNRTYDNDIALWKLKEDADIFYRTICIPKPGTSVENPMTVAGWGLKDERDYEMAEKLQEVKVFKVRNDTCVAALKPYPVTENMLCAGGNKGEDACQGDSGGPLMGLQPATKQLYLAGVVSWGIGCGRPGYYGVYTKVSHYKLWIESYIFT